MEVEGVHELDSTFVRDCTRIHRVTYAHDLSTTRRILYIYHQKSCRFSGLSKRAVASHCRERVGGGGGEGKRVGIRKEKTGRMTEKKREKEQYIITKRDEYGVGGEGMEEEEAY